MVVTLIRLKLYHSINALFKLYRMQRFHRVMGKSLYVEDSAARIQWRGRRELFSLKTPNKAAAAAKARDIYAVLAGAGWDAALAKFKPEMQRKSASTVGEFLTELEKHWSGKPKTFGDYSRSFRTIVSQMFGI